MCSQLAELTPKGHETQIIAEILEFWQAIPASELQVLAARGEIEQAAKRWEKRARAFYHRYSSSFPQATFQLLWNEVYWRYYRSIVIVDKSGASFMFPKDCFRYHGITPTFYDHLWQRWQATSDQSLTKFFQIIKALQRDLLVELSPDELACLKKAPRSMADPAIQASGWLMPQFLAKETGLSPNQLRTALTRLRHYGILGMRAHINYARIGLAPYIYIAKSPLTGWQQEYCFTQVEALERGLKINGLAVPPQAVHLASHFSKSKGVFEPILSFTAHWNLAQLSMLGWGDECPPLIGAAAANADVGSVILDFQAEAIRLQYPEPLYLERAQTCSARMLRGEFGGAGQQRLRELRKAGALAWSPTFHTIQCSSEVFLYCQTSSSEVLDRFESHASHFPRSRSFRGAEWLLLVLSIPTSWASQALATLEKLCSRHLVKNLLLDTHQGAIEQYLRFTQLWDQHAREWIA
ncbi:MAG: hypothetical protein ACE5OZ_08035 [Candidatus Heimdallarchaeota archaeon]